MGLCLLGSNIQHHHCSLEQFNGSLAVLLSYNSVLPSTVWSVCLTFLVFFSLQVFKNLQLFMENKQPEDDLFDRLNVST